MQFKHVFICVVIQYCCGYGQEYGYDGKVGPQFWGRKFHSCASGKLQSPIDIEENNVTVVNFPPLIFENFHVAIEKVRLLNNGHTVQLSIENGSLPAVHGGPMKSVHNFAQLHFHWGKTDSEGSENLINNHSFPLELHMVFFKKEYETFQKAANQSDGLLVLSFLYHTSEKGNPNYSLFEDKLLKVQKEGDTVYIADFGSLDNFTTAHRNRYFAYKGSLTTPPCSEGVTWIEFMDTIPLSHSQIQEFRLLSGQWGKMEHNFRPIQPLYDRVVYMNGQEKSSTSRLRLSVTTLLVCLFFEYTHSILLVGDE